MKHLLVCGFDFPPIGGPAALRMTSFVNRMPEMGWIPHVVTVREDQQIIPNVDARLKERLAPECTVHRTHLVEPYTNPLYRLATGSSSKQTDLVNPESVSGNGAPDSVGGTASADDRAAAGRSGGRGSRLVRLMESIILPDRVAGWIPFAVREGMKVIEKWPVEAIISSSPPVSTQVIGMILAWRTGLPWIAEFRDPWTQYAFARKRFFPFDAMERELERNVLHRASRIVCTTEPMADGFVEIHPDVDRSKFVVVPGFYDEANFRDVQPMPQDRFTVIFAGHLYEAFAPHTLFEGLSRALASRPEMRGRVRCLFVGRQYSGLGELVARWGLDDVVERRGFCSNEEVLALLLGSHACYYRVSFPRVIAAKLYEYLRSGRHILAVIRPDHPAARIIRETKAGTVIPPGRVDLAAEQLLHLFDLYTSNGGIPEKDVGRPEIRRFESHARAGELISIVDELT